MNNSKSQVTKKDIAIFIFLVVLTIVIVANATYSFWKKSFVQKEENSITMSCLNVSYKENTDAINLPNVYPVSDDVGMSNLPFTFTLTNNCDQDVNYQVNLETIKDSTLKTAYVAAVIDNDPVQTIDKYPVGKLKDKENIASNILKTGTIKTGSNNTVVHNLRLWMPDTVKDTSAMSQTYQGRIIVTASLD